MKSRQHCRILIISVISTVVLLYYLSAHEDGNIRYSKPESLYDYQLKQLTSQYHSSLTGDTESQVQNFIKDYFTDESDSIQATNVYISLNQVHGNSNNLEKLKSAINMGTAFGNPSLAYLHGFFDDVISTFLNEESLYNTPVLNQYKDTIDRNRLLNAAVHSPDSDVFTEEFLASFLELSQEQMKALKSSHDNSVQKINTMDIESIVSKYNGQGIVYVGGGNFNWLSLLSIQKLRSLGSKLPVEVIIPTLQEYELDFCQTILPALGARCVLLPQVLGSEIYKKVNFAGYQYKILAILACSFEEVLLLDADNIPVLNPDRLFNDPAFKKFGMVTWPDFWKRTTSPYFFEIANIKIGKHRSRFGYHQHGIYTMGIEAEDADNNDYVHVPLHDREGCIPDVSSESGQLLVSKKSHIKEMLLSLYYNLYGPEFYYPLFSQSTHGEGDKETYAMSTLVFNNTFYQVNSLLHVIGHFTHNEFKGTAMAQYDPGDDYKILEENIQILAGSKNHEVVDLKDIRFDKLPKFKSYEEAEQHGYHGLNHSRPSVMFIHANFPKLNPIQLKNEGKLTELDSNGVERRLRLFGFEMIKFVNNDLELEIWETMFQLLCVKQIKMTVFDKYYERAYVCDEVSKQLEFLKSAPLLG